MVRVIVSTSGFDGLAAATAEEVRQAVIETAKAENAIIQATDPVPDRTLRYVNGTLGAPEESVTVDGVIVYDYPRYDLVTRFAIDTLRSLSPVKSGAYREHHQLYLNDEPVENLSAWRPGARVVIANAVPYARKIELGKMKMRVPGTDHVYRQASLIVRREYGELLAVRFTFVGLEAVEFERDRRGAHSVLERGFIVRGRRGNVGAIRYPALVFSEH